MLRYFKTALLGTVFLIASGLVQTATAETQGCVMDSWSRFLDAGPQEYKIVEEIKTKNGVVLAIEFDEIAGPYGKVFLFLLKGEACFLRAVSFGSYALTNLAAGEVGPDGRLYHSDLYEPDVHSTLGFSERRPRYITARKAALQALE